MFDFTANYYGKYFDVCVSTRPTDCSFGFTISVNGIGIWLVFVSLYVYFYAEEPREEEPPYGYGL